jgi:hypothetical protein
LNPGNVYCNWCHAEYKTEAIFLSPVNQNITFVIMKEIIYCMVDSNNVKLITTSHKSLSIVKKPKPKWIKYRKCMAIVNSKYKWHVLLTMKGSWL